MYEIIYDYNEEKNIRETFKGSWSEVVEYTQNMRQQGCYNIAVNYMYPEQEY